MRKRKKKKNNPQPFPWLIQEVSFQRGTRASASRCSSIKPEAGKCFDETLGGHSASISNRERTCDRRKSRRRKKTCRMVHCVWKNKNAPKLWTSWFLIWWAHVHELSQFKGDPQYEALSALQSINRVAERKKKGIQFLTYLIGDLAWQVKRCHAGDWTLIL